MRKLKLFTLALVFAFSSFASFALDQIPYTNFAYDNSNNIIIGNVDVRLTLYVLSNLNNAIYQQENTNVPTNNYGMYSVTFGTGLNFSNIVAHPLHVIKCEVKLHGSQDLYKTIAYDNLLQYVGDINKSGIGTTVEPNEITLSEGAILYGSSANIATTLPIGTNGYALFSNGSSPYWGEVLTNIIANPPLAFDQPTRTLTISAAGSLSNGYLTSNDWNTFNNKQHAFTVSAPVAYDGITNILSMPFSTATVDGYLKHGDWSMFNGKQDAINVTSPILYDAATKTISIQNANDTDDGFLTSTDWNTFTNKQDAFVLTDPLFWHQNGGTNELGIHLDNSLIVNPAHQLGINPANSNTWTSVQGFSTTNEQSDAFVNSINGVILSPSVTKINGIKVNPDFGNQDISTTGTVASAQVITDYINVNGDIDATTFNGALNGNAATATLATTATNIAGGVAGSVPVQTAAGTTSMLAIGAANTIIVSNGTTPAWVAQLTDDQVSDNLTASKFKDANSVTDAVDLGTTEVAGVLPSNKIATGTANQVLTTDGTTTTWGTLAAANLPSTIAYKNAANNTFGAIGQPSDMTIYGTVTVNGILNAIATGATNVEGGFPGSIPYQTAAGTTSMLAIGAANTIIVSNGTTPAWVAQLTDDQVSDILTSSKFKDANSVTDAVDLGTTEVAGVLPSNKIATGTANQVLTTDGTTTTWGTLAAANLPSTIAYKNAANNTFGAIGQPSDMTIYGTVTVNGILNAIATGATNVEGGFSGSIPYQTSGSNTSMLAIGTANQVLVSNGTTPVWTSTLLAANLPTNVVYTDANNTLSGTNTFSASNNFTAANTFYKTTTFNNQDGNNAIIVTNNGTTPALKVDGASGNDALYITNGNLNVNNGKATVSGGIIATKSGNTASDYAIQATAGGSSAFAIGAVGTVKFESIAGSAQTVATVYQNNADGEGLDVQVSNPNHVGIALVVDTKAGSGSGNYGSAASFTVDNVNNADYAVGINTNGGSDSKGLYIDHSGSGTALYVEQDGSGPSAIFGGNVAIGSTNVPTNALEVSGNATISGTLTVSNGNIVAINNTVAAKVIHAEDDINTNGHLYVDTYSVLVGNVAVGSNTNPTHALEVTGNATVSGTLNIANHPAMRFIGWGAGAPGAGAYYEGDVYVQLSAGNNRLYIFANGAWHYLAGMDS